MVVDSRVLYVGITGKARQGKSSFVDLYLEEARSVPRVGMLSFIKLPVSEPMKRLWFESIVGISVAEGEALKDSEYAPLGLTHRDVLASLGDWGRSQHKHFWMHRLDRLVQDDPYPYDSDLTVALIPDVRLDDEAEWIRSRGGHIVHITSNVLPTISGSHTVQSRPVTVGDRDVVVINDGTLDDLRAQARSLLEHHIHPFITNAKDEIDEID